MSRIRRWTWPIRDKGRYGRLQITRDACVSGRRCECTLISLPATSFTATHSCNPIAIALKFAAWRTKVAIYSGSREETQSLSNWAYSARCMYRVTGKMGDHRIGSGNEYPTTCTSDFVSFEIQFQFSFISTVIRELFCTEP